MTTNLIKLVRTCDNQMFMIEKSIRTCEKRIAITLATKHTN